MVPMIPGNDTVIEVFNVEEEDRKPKKAVPHTMSSAAMKAVFNNFTSGASRRAEQEYYTDTAAHQETDPTEVTVRSARLST